MAPSTMLRLGAATLFAGMSALQGAALPANHLLAAEPAAAFNASAEFYERYGASSGCGMDPPYTPSPDQSQFFEFEFQGETRGYLMHIPTTYDQNRPTPIVLSFHGWSISPTSNQNWMGYNNNIEEDNFIAVYPAGATDCSGNNCWSSWNAGGSSNNTADAPAGWTCAQSTSSCQACATSCQPLGLCNNQQARNCNWATCLDDIAFVREIVIQLTEKLCVDRARIFASGESLGGLMAWQVAQSMPDVIAASAPTVGQPHPGFTGPPEGNHQISVMHLTANNDRTIPPGGGQSNDGWFYSSVADNAELWGDYNGCSGQAVSYPGPNELTCSKTRGSCEREGTDVIHCSMQGNHFTTIRGFWGAHSFRFFAEHPKTEAWFVANYARMANNTQ